MMIGRILRALRLDSSLYEEVEAREDLNRESWIIILIIMLVNGIVGGILATFSDSSASSASSFFVTLLSVSFSIILGYIISVGSIWLVGTKLLGGMAEIGELRRAISYAYAPNILLSIPCVNFLAILWFWVTSFIAVRQSMDMSNLRTLVVIIVAGILSFAPTMCISGLGMSFLGLSMF